MNTMMRLSNAAPLLFLWTIGAQTQHVSAWPTGAGGCPAGEAAVGGGHKARMPGDLGALEEGNFTLTLDGDAVSSDAAVPVSAGTEYTLSLSGAEFRGFLFRLQLNGTDASTFISPGTVGDPQATSPGVCDEGIGAVTHSMNDAKTEATAVLNIASPGTYTMDVTVVTRLCSPDSPVLPAPNDNVEPCDPEFSGYHYSGYTLDVTGGVAATSAGVDAAVSVCALVGSVAMLLVSSMSML